MIECETIYGGKCLKTKDEMRMRISSYAFVENKKKLLVTKIKSTGKYFPPGGEVNILKDDPLKGVDELLFDGLQRELKEETNIDIEKGEHFYFTENFFNYNPKSKLDIDETYYNLCHFYKCKPLSFEPSEEFQIEDGESELPQWVDMDEFNEENCQRLFWEALAEYRKFYER